MLKQSDVKLKKKKEYHYDTINEELSFFKIIQGFFCNP